RLRGAAGALVQIAGVDPCDLFEECGVDFARAVALTGGVDQRPHLGRRRESVEEVATVTASCQREQVRDPVSDPQRVDVPLPNLPTLGRTRITDLATLWAVPDDLEPHTHSRQLPRERRVTDLGEQHPRPGSVTEGRPARGG